MSLPLSVYAELIFAVTVGAILGTVIADWLRGQLRDRRTRRPRRDRPDGYD